MRKRIQALALMAATVPAAMIVPIGAAAAQVPDEQVGQRVIAVLNDYAGYMHEEIQPDFPLEMILDSIGRINVAIVLEEEFGVPTSGRRCNGCGYPPEWSVQQLIDFVRANRTR